MNKKRILPGLIIVACLGLIVVATLQSHSGFAVLSPAGTIGSSERHLMAVALSLSLIVVVPVFVMLFGFAWRYRDTNPKKAKYSPNADRNIYAEIVWWGIPLILIAILSVITWRSTHQLDPFKDLSSKNPTMTIQVVALDWKWLFIYPEKHIATVNYVEFPKNTPVDFQITSDAPMNSFWIPKLGGQMYAMSGMMTHLHLMADQTGSFRGLSANISGEGFAGMNFTAKSVERADYDTWARQTRYHSPDLDTVSYTSLTKPSQNVKPASYALAQRDLYDTIMMKYMMPSATQSTSTGSDSKAVHDTTHEDVHKQTDPSMPGMQHSEGSDVE